MLCLNILQLYSTEFESGIKTKCKAHLFIFSRHYNSLTHLHLYESHTLPDKWLGQYSHKRLAGDSEYAARCVRRAGGVPCSVQICTRKAIEAFFIGFHQLVGSTESQPNRAKGHRVFPQNFRMLYLKPVIIHTIC